MRSSPWIRGAPHVGFSTTMRKINSRTSFGVGLLPTCLRTLEISRQYIQKPVRCQRTTVSDVTMRRDCFQAEQTRRAITQKNLSKTVLRQNSMRIKNSAIPCRDGCLIQVIPSPSNAKNLSRGTRAAYLYIYGYGGTRTFSRTLRWFGLGSSFVAVVQPSQSHMRKDVT